MGTKSGLKVNIWDAIAREPERIRGDPEKSIMKPYPENPYIDL